MWYSFITLTIRVAIILCVLSYINLQFKKFQTDINQRGFLKSFSIGLSKVRMIVILSHPAPSLSTSSAKQASQS